MRPSGEHIGFDCQDWQDQSLAYALAAKPDVVVIANRSTGYTSPDLHWRVPLNATGKPATSVEEASALYEAGLRGMVDSLRAEGIAVVLLQNAPSPESVYNQQTLLRKAVSPPVPEGFSREIAVKQAQGGRAVELDASERDSGVLLVDSFELLCPPTSATCPLAQDGVSLYLDPAHVSQEGTKLAKERLEAAISTARAVKGVSASDR